MSPQPWRLPAGGLIERGRRLRFTFDGRPLEGHPGDSLAAALLANGIRLVGRSFKYHRPRGIFSAGVEEPNALVRLGQGARAEPNLRATEVELFDSLEASSQNCWPSPAFDLGAINSLVAPLLPAGFYYKTFKWPVRLWPFYERLIRRMAGLGRAPDGPDPDAYARRHAHVDVLVVGAGPAGLAAARAAGRTGARVLLVEQDSRPGGALLRESATIDGRDGLAWVAGIEAELASMPEVRLLTRTTAFGRFDGNLVALCERLADHLPQPPAGTPRQRLWQVRAAQVVLATGAIQRGLVFADNDRPGVMLAAAAQAYVNRFAVRPGARAVVATAEDSAYAVARDLQAAGIEVAALVDSRAGGHSRPPEGVRHVAGAAVVQALGRRAVQGALVQPLAGGTAEKIACDLLCVAGGWSPTLHLYAQAGGHGVLDDRLGAFVPGPPVAHLHLAGAARGSLGLAACLALGHAAGHAAAAAAGFDAPGDAAPRAEPEAEPSPVGPLRAPSSGRSGKAFVDLQGDVTAADVELAAREGYDSVEHLKRYTTLGMGTDQGRTSNATGVALLAAATGREPGAFGHTTFRPPFAPVTIGAVVAGETGVHFAPLRRTPIDSWHEANGAVFVNAGLWRRPAAYPQAGEDLAAATAREAAAVRARVGIVDVSTLGRILIDGPDALALLERVYCNGWQSLKIGRCRYGLMLREDGIVLDDGVTARIGPHRYVMTTTTAQADSMLRHLEHATQVLWPQLDVRLVPVQEAWATVALAGPGSRAVLARTAEGFEVEGTALPPQGVATGRIAGIPARVFRISFSGELAYEIGVAADHGPGLWQALLDAGRAEGITTYGTEAMGVLRIEKGHVAGAELNGRTNPDDLGLGRMVRKSGDFIGKAWLGRPGLVDPDRRQLVGLLPADGSSAIPRASFLVADPKAPPPVPILGEITSTCWSPALGRPIALALLRTGRSRHGETLHAAAPLHDRSIAVTVGSPHFYDPEGERQRG